MYPAAMQAASFVTNQICGGTPAIPSSENFAAQGSAGCSTPGNGQGQHRQGSEQADLVEGIPAPCREVGLDDF